MTRRVVTTLVLLLAWQAGGCAAPAAVPDPFGAVPPDFTLDVLIVTGSEVGDRPEAPLRPGRFILLPDGSLHYGADRQRNGARLPDLRRAVSRAEVAGLWSIIQQAGLDLPDQAAAPRNTDLLHAAAEEIVCLLDITARGRHWQVLRRFRADEAPDPVGTSLVRRLARLAWASEISAEPQRVIPKRYDFGPDPYARYRQDADDDAS